jgi:peptide/nickel transport system permease protein
MTRGWRLALPLTALVGLHLASLFGGFLAPNSALEQNRSLAWAPPTKLRFLDAAGDLHLRPFVYPLVPDPDQLDVYHEDSSRPAPLRLLVRGDRYRLAGLFPTDIHLLGVDAPAKLLFLGTDGYGRDVLARLLVGGRVSLFAGLLAAAMALTVGALVGSLAGFYGGRTDTLLMRLVELFLALPWLYLLLAVRAFLPFTLSTFGAFALLTAIIGMVGWAGPARLVRGVVLSAKEKLFVSAARSLGAPSGFLLRRHVLPQALVVLLTQATLLTPRFSLAEVTLSFFGLGVSEPHPSWGNLIAPLQTYHVMSTYWWLAAPAVGVVFLYITYFSLHTSLVSSA